MQQLRVGGSKCRKQTCVQDLVEEAADQGGSDVQL